MNNQGGVSLVIPAFNEENGLRQTLEDCRNCLNSLKIHFEIIVVDDGSTDATASIAEGASARVIRHPANGGYGRALKGGILAARYETIIIMDADGTYPVHSIPLLLEHYRQGFDMVVGQRTGEHYEQSVFKFSLRRLLQFLVEWSCGKTIPDINSGLRVFARTPVKAFFRHLCDTFSFTTSLTLAYMMTGRFVAYVPIAYAPRVGSSHVRLLKDSLLTLGYILRQILYFNPLKIFLLFSLIWLGIGLSGFIFFALTRLMISYYFGVLSLFGAFLMLGMGLLAEQIRQVVISISDNKTIFVQKSDTESSATPLVGKRENDHG